MLLEVAEKSPLANTILAGATYNSRTSLEKPIITIGGYYRLKKHVLRGIIKK